MKFNSLLLLPPLLLLLLPLLILILIWSLAEAATPVESESVPSALDVAQWRLKGKQRGPEWHKGRAQTSTQKLLCLIATLPCVFFYADALFGISEDGAETAEMRTDGALDLHTHLW